VPKAQPVTLLNGPGQSLDDLGRRQGGKRSSLKMFGEIFPLNELGCLKLDSFMTAGHENRDDIRMAQPRCI
jgi:hypothetical protein